MPEDFDRVLRLAQEMTERLTSVIMVINNETGRIRGILDLLQKDVKEVREDASQIQEEIKVVQALIREGESRALQSSHKLLATLSSGLEQINLKIIALDKKVGEHAEFRSKEAEAKAQVEIENKKGKFQVWVTVISSVFGTAGIALAAYFGVSGK